MKKVQYSVIIAFSALMLIMCILSLFPDSDGFSEFENRWLSSRPVLSLDSFFSGEFEEDYEEYLLDNFPLRNLSMQGYQSYTSLLFLDVFPQNVSVLMSVDVDDFVMAPLQDESAAQQKTQSGTGSLADGGGIEKNGSDGQHDPESLPGGEENRQSTTARPGTESRPGIEIQQGTEGLNAHGEQPYSAGMQEGYQQHETEQEQVPGQGEEQLTNSLIIHEDRIMMPAGSIGFKSFGNLLSDAAALLPDVNFYSITGPTSAAFYASDEYSTGDYDQSKAEPILEANVKNVKVVKVYDMLMEHRNEHIYFRSDVHWTALGAYYAYTAFCDSAGIQAADLDTDFTVGTYEPFLGGLYSQIYKMPQAARLKNNPEKLDYYIPKIGHQLTLYKMGDLNAPYSVDSIINTDFKSLGAYKYSCFAWGDQRIEKIESESTSGRKVLVIKDSYGSAFVPFLVPNYSTIYVIDPKGFNLEGCPVFDAKTLIREEEIDDVIFCFSIYGSGRSIIHNALGSLLLN